MKLNQKYIVRVIKQDVITEFKVTAQSRQQAYDKVEKEWNAVHGEGDFKSHIVGVLLDFI